jgi:streptomycin 6-kinase
MIIPTPLVPASLPVVAEMSRHEPGRRWLAGLPALIHDLRERWSLRLGAPFHGGSCSWVAPARLPDGTDAVLKVVWPHREAAGEAEALRLWDGRGAVRVYRHDAERYALLLERCEPGTELAAVHDVPAEQRLILAAEVLAELSRVPVPAGTALERVGDVTGDWADLLQERVRRLRPGFDAGLTALGARLLRELPATATREVVLHGDFNPGNLLAARRRPWLAIDAKPMVGDPGFDPWPLLVQVDDPFRYPDPRRVVAERFALVADILGEDPRRLVAWALARTVELALWEVEHGNLPAGRVQMDRAGIIAGR